MGKGLSGMGSKWERCYSTHTVPLVVAVRIALTGKPTTQSSTAHGGVSNRAVDDNTNGNYGAGSCTHTENQANAWWTVDLQATYAVDKVHAVASAVRLVHVHRRPHQRVVAGGCV